LEAVCGHHCFFWHLDYDHVGTNNDVNILHASDFSSSFLDGRFEDLEKDVVPFSIADQSFNKMFVLVDGAYPKFERFVKPMKFPILPEQKRFKEWQAAARKDIKYAFAILQGKFQAVVRSIQIWDINHESTIILNLLWQSAAYVSTTCVLPIG
jgi:Plant transposon protein